MTMAKIQNTIILNDTEMLITKDNYSLIWNIFDDLFYYSRVNHNWRWNPINCPALE